MSLHICPKFKECNKQPTCHHKKPHPFDPDFCEDNPEQIPLDDGDACPECKPLSAKLELEYKILDL